MRITQNPIKKFTTMLKETYSGKLPAQVIYGYLTYIRDEVKLGAPGPLKLTKRLKIFGQGFLSWSYFVYELEKNNPELYLSDLTQKGFTTLNINPELTRNKKIFHDFMRENGLDELCPDVLGLIDDGALRLNRYNNLEELLEERKKIVFKPFYGNSGKGVYICEKNGKEIKINGKKTTINSIKKIMTSFEQYLIEEYIYQADFLSDIFPGSPNTIRMIVMNPKDSQPFFPTAALRVGTPSLTLSSR